MIGSGRIDGGRGGAAALFLCAALVAGCAHTAQQKGAGPVAAATAAQDRQRAELTPALVRKVIVKGKTSGKELLAALGTPNAVEPNRQRPSKEQLAKAKGALPPVAHTREFWKYWSKPFKSDGSLEAKVYNVLVLMDDDGVALDYLTAETKVDVP